MVLNQGAKPPVIEQYEGRHAISIPAEQLKAAYAKIQSDHPELIVHDIMELNEQVCVCVFVVYVGSFIISFKPNK
jgi:hypothetical protein